MSALHTKNDVTIDFASGLSLTGTLVYDSYEVFALETNEGNEYLSTNLDEYGYLKGAGQVYIKDWSEHTGLAADLESKGLVRILDSVKVGSFGSTAYLVEVTF